ncbi:haptoglobin-like [Engraulis encrasicolus]|uniref:haptoglobin-like n=1 Tax=Engraulis encrasicolus TaxID=184585 RepID=UPI002FD30C5F
MTEEQLEPDSQIHFEHFKIFKPMWSSMIAVVALVAWSPHGATAVSLREPRPGKRGPPPPPPPKPKPSGPSRTVPWQVMVYLDEGDFFGVYGGGALLSDRWVVTSGRNLLMEHSKKTPVPKVYVGVAKFEDAWPSKEVPVEKVFVHPGFQNSSKWANDVALIKLSAPVAFNQTVMPIPLPEQGDEEEETPGVAAIFGAWDQGIIHELPSAIKHLKLPVVSRKECRASFTKPSDPVIDDTKFCTGPSEHFMNTCFNDAGSAMVFQNAKTNRVYIGGVVSNNMACAIRRHAVSTKISAYLPWIRDTMREDQEVAVQRAALVADLYSGKI